MTNYLADYYEEALASMRAVTNYYMDVIETLVEIPSGHGSYGELQGDGSDYCECGEFLGHDFPPEETELRWMKHRLALANVVVKDSGE